MGEVSQKSIIRNDAGSKNYPQVYHVYILLIVDDSHAIYIICSSSMKYGHLPTPRNHSLQQSSQTVLAPVGIVASHPVAPATGHVDSTFGEAPPLKSIW